jgi:hypothetical protein
MKPDACNPTTFQRQSSNILLRALATKISRKLILIITMTMNINGTCPKAQNRTS